MFERIFEWFKPFGSLEGVIGIIIILIIALVAFILLPKWLQKQ